jgi:electron transport complex protein RnfB
MNEKDVYATIAERHGYPNSTYYRKILETAITPIEAKVGLALPKPPEQITPEQLAEKLNLDLKTVENALESLFQKGFASAKDIKTRKGWRFVRNPYYLFMTNMSAIDVDPTASPLYKAWYDFSKAEFYRDLAKEYAGVEKPSQRVLPYFKAILNNSETLPHEDIRMFLKEARRIAVASCSCRQCFAAGGEPCKKNDDYNVCINFGKSAEFLLDRGVAKAISPEEALEIFDQCEEDGAVHGWDPVVNVLCNCCDDCCFAMKPCIQYGVSLSRVIQKSRYIAKTSMDLCKGCQKCIKRCIFSAIEVQKRPGSKIDQTVVNEEKCFGCGACVVSCPTGARFLELASPVRTIEEYQSWLERIRW